MAGLDYQTLLSSLQNSPLSAAERANSQPLAFSTDWNSPSVSDNMVQQAYQQAWGRAAQPWEVEAWQGTAGDGTATAVAPTKPTNLGMTAPAPAPAPAPTLRPYEKNPYLDEMAQAITSQMNDNFSRNVMPQVRSGAMAAGGFGGSRQGVVEANATNDMNRSLSQNLANLYGTDYNQQQNRNLSEFQGNQSYDLGLRNNDLGFGQLDFNINQGNFNNNLTGAKFGLDVYNTLQNNNNLGLTAGTSMQNKPLEYQTYFNNSANAAGGMGGQTTGQQSQPGSPLTGALAGYQLATAYNKSNPYSSGSNPYLP